MYEIWTNGGAGWWKCDSAATREEALEKIRDLKAVRNWGYEIRVR